MIYKSSMNSADLINSWDTYTSPARFAGADEVLDEVFISRRTGNKIFITRKPKMAFEPFALVFRGTIKETSDGSMIQGFYTAKLFDYILLLFIFSIYFAISLTLISRKGLSIFSIDGFIITAAAASICYLLLYPKKRTKRKFEDLFEKITKE